MPAARLSRAQGKVFALRAFERRVVYLRRARSGEFNEDIDQKSFAKSSLEAMVSSFARRQARYAGLEKDGAEVPLSSIKPCEVGKSFVSFCHSVSIISFLYRAT